MIARLVTNEPWAYVFKEEVQVATGFWRQIKAQRIQPIFDFIVRYFNMPHARLASRNRRHTRNSGDGAV